MRVQPWSALRGFVAEVNRRWAIAGVVSAALWYGVNPCRVTLSVR